MLCESFKLTVIPIYQWSQPNCGELIPVFPKENLSGTGARLSETRPVPVDWQNCYVTTGLWNCSKKRHMMMWLREMWDCLWYSSQVVIENEFDVILWDFVVEIGGLTTKQWHLQQDTVIKLRTKRNVTWEKHGQSCKLWSQNNTDPTLNNQEQNWNNAI